MGYREGNASEASAEIFVIVDLALAQKAEVKKGKRVLDLTPDKEYIVCPLIVGAEKIGLSMLRR